MSTDEYLTILEPGHAQTRVLGSRFFGSAIFSDSEDDVDLNLEAERKQRHDATHRCYAFRLRAGDSILERASDAGEPKGTAGHPILREIQFRNLVNTHVIVSRYFGGTKLGTGNLARAYAECASQSLHEAKLIQRYVESVVRIECPFEYQSLVYHHAQKFDASVEPQPAVDHAAFLVRLRASASNSLCSELEEEGRGRLMIMKVAG